MKFAALLLCLAAAPAAAEMVVPTRPIRAAETIGADALAIAPGSHPDAAATLDAVVGQEARTALYPGRPILTAQIGPPAVVERNAAVTLVYASGALQITTEGRALARGAAGERIRVINLASKASLFGTVRADGTVAITE